MNKISIVMALAVSMLALGACKKEPENAEGPVEAAGEEADEAAADVSEATEEAGEATGEAVEDATD
jgi:hypothetical protein